MAQRKRKHHPSHEAVAKGDHVYQGTLRTRPSRFQINHGVPSVLQHRLPIVVYGDESTSDDLVSYGLVVIHKDDLGALELDVQKMLNSAGEGQEGLRYHSKIILSKDRRDRSIWKHLTKDDAEKLCTNLAKIFIAYRTTALIGIVHKSTFPKTFPDGNTIQNEDFYFLAYTAAVHPFKLHDYFPQYLESEYYIDRLDQCSVQIVGRGYRKLQRILEKHRSLPNPIVVGEVKPLMIDLADLVAYAAARAFSQATSSNTRICEEVTSIINPVVTDFWWNPPNSENILMQKLGEEYDTECGAIRNWHNPRVIGYPSINLGMPM